VGGGAIGFALAGALWALIANASAPAAASAATAWNFL
jgi:hypothetical protein